MINRNRLSVGLGIAQILNWGTSYYIPMVMGKQVAADLGFSSAALIGGFTVGLLLTGAVSPLIGRYIEAHGGRGVSTAAPLAIASGLVCLSFSQGLATWYLAWMIVGCGMAMGLYDAAFGTIGRLLGNQSRGAFVGVTLLGGIGPVVALPGGTYLIGHIGWRDTLLIYAAIEVLVLTPLVWFCVPPLSAAAPVSQRMPAPTDAPLAKPARFAFFWMMTYVTVRNAINGTVFVHSLTLLQGMGFSLAVAVAATAALGPSQVGARVVDWFFGRKFSPLQVALFGAALLPLGIFGLLAGMPALFFGICYGAGNGIYTVSRGTLPMHVFGPAGYAVRVGKLAMPSMIATAVSPTLFAPLVAGLPAEWVFVILGAMGMVAMLCVVMLGQGQRPTVRPPIS